MGTRQEREQHILFESECQFSAGSDRATRSNTEGVRRVRTKKRMIGEACRVLRRSDLDVRGPACNVGFEIRVKQSIA